MFEDGTNPFLKAKEAAAAEKPEGAEVKPDAAPPNALLAAEAADGTPADADLDAEDAIEAERAEEVGDEGAKRKVVGLDTFKKRVGKLTSRAKTAEGELTVAQRELAKAKGQLEQSDKLSTLFTEKYRGNAERLSFDIDFLDSLEALSKEDAGVMTTVNAVMARLKNAGRSAPVTETTPETKPETKPDAANEAALIVLRDSAVTKTAAALKESGVDPRFVSLISKAAKDLGVAELSAFDPMKFAVSYLRERNLTAADVIAAAASPDTKTAPSTKGQGAPNTNSPAGGKPASEETPRFNTAAELHDARRARLSKLATELGLGN